MTTRADTKLRTSSETETFDNLFGHLYRFRNFKFRFWPIPNYISLWFVIILWLSSGMTLTDTLDCQTSYQCHSGNFRSLREFFIHQASWMKLLKKFLNSDFQVCSKHAYSPKNEHGTSSEHPYADLQPIEYSSSKCRTWFVKILANLFQRYFAGTSRVPHLVMER